MKLIEYSVVDFNGREKTVKGPEGRTQEEAQKAYDDYLRQRAYVEQERQKLAAYDPEALDMREAELNPVHGFVRGVGSSALSTVKGVDQMLGRESADIVEQGAKLRENTSGMPAAAGRLYGDIGQALSIGLAGRAAGLSPFAAEMLAGSTMGAVQPAEGWGERAGNFGMAAGLTALPFLPGGMRPDANAQQLMDRAMAAGTPMRLTPGQAMGNTAAKLEQGLESYPLVGSAIRSEQRKGLEDWNKLVLSEVAPMLPDGTIQPVRGFGSEGLSEVNARFNKAYDTVFESAPDTLSVMDEGFVGRLRSEFNNLKPHLRPEEYRVLEAEAVELSRAADAGEIPARAAKRLKRDFHERARGAFNRGEYDLGRGYEAMANSVTQLLSDNLPPEMAEYLRHIDKQYSRFLPVVRAQSMIGAQKSGVLTPAQLTNALKAEDDSLRKKRFAMGNMPDQAETLAAEESLGRVIPSAGPGTAEKLFAGAPLMAAGTGAIDPAWALGAYGVGGALAAGVRAGAPVARGQVPGQALARNAMEAMARNAPGAMSQITPTVISGMNGEALAELERNRR